MGILAYRALCSLVSRVMFWCVGVPLAALFAAYLAAIVMMCARELWKTWKNDRARRKQHEKADPPV